MHFAVDIQRVPMMPFRFRRRVGFRNSKIRLENSGFVNYERWRIFVLDVCIKWGEKLDPEAPAWSYAGKRSAAAVAHRSAARKVTHGQEPTH